MSRAGLFVVCLVLLPGCRDKEAADLGVEKVLPMPGPPCEVRFTWLQKDAYRETAGRSTAAWPPHTTTTLSARCHNEPLYDVFLENHGTKPGEKDAAGNEFLVEVKTEHFFVTQGTAESMRAEYESCECAGEGGTKFLTMDALEGTTVKELVDEVSKYARAHLDCGEDPGTEALVTKLNEGKINDALAELPKCEWAVNHDWGSGFNASLAAVLGRVQQKLTDYHVCNNDAALQSELWNSWREARDVKTCDSTGAACRGPAWFYTP